jgi:hypothetical protein
MADEPGIAHVTEANVAALVGREESSPKQLMWQVQLKQGEAAELLGVAAAPLATDDSKEAWYKIAPPAGEFRWIHKRFVTRNPDEIVAKDDSAASDQPTPVAAFLPKEPAEKPKSTWDDGFVARKKRPSDSMNKSSSNAIVAAPTPEAIPSPQVESPSSKDDDLLTQIAILDVELSLMVAGDATGWRTDKLKRRGETLLSQSTTNLERGRARLLLNRIEEFHELENRYKNINLAASPDDLAQGKDAEKPDRLVVDEATELGTGLRERLNQPDAEPAKTKFDGTGYLMPVHSKRSDVPPFALVDGTGRIVQYVTPVPGLNLNRYRKLEVGLFGQRGFVPTLQTPHVTAQRIIVLERNR